MRKILQRMAILPNCRAWYSCDRETGLPDHTPPRARLAWLSAAPDDAPQAGANLVFRVRKLRSRRATHLDGVRVCPPEDGVPRGQPVTCERCQLCWQPLAEDTARRVALPLVPPEGGR